jgi:hypothetical protein
MEPSGATKIVRLTVYKRDEVPKDALPPRIRIVVPPPREDASLKTKIGRLRRDLTVWFKAGAPMAPREVRKSRQAICVACDYWNAMGNLGLGECKYPGCGCSRVKAALATSKCPMGKWHACMPEKP